MSIKMIGIDHNIAAVDVRALFSFTKKSAVSAMAQLKNIDGICGCIILSTCNRMEMWVSTSEDWQGSLTEELCHLKNVEITEFSQFFVERQGEVAVDHLFRLACGLESQIICEDQIVTQVKEALSLARDNYFADSILEVLFRTAITAAKKVKTEVIFSRADVTAVDCAVALLRKQGVCWENQNCMVIGNGEMGKLAAQTIKAAGANVTVTVRQYHSGVVNIPLGCERINYGERMKHLPKCKVIISATASPNYTLTKELLAQVALEEEIYLIDLAVPRDIEPTARELPKIILYDIDDFKSESSQAHLAEPFKQAEVILEHHKEEFFYWLSGRDLIPRINEIKVEAATDLSCRIHKILAKLPVGENERSELKTAIEVAAGKMVNKMMFGLKESLAEESFRECVEGLEKLYDE